jgi:tetratricopeptide (TPR) repeat protein
MGDFRTCTYCGSDLKQDFRSVAFCSCGWVDRKSEKKMAQETDKRMAKRIVIFGVLMAAFMGHLFNWGGFAFRIPVIRAQQVTGILSAQGYDELAQICTALNKWSCAQNAYNQEFSKSNDATALLKLAKLQQKIDKKTEATQSYERYFAANGDDGVAMIELGNLLIEKKEFTKALKLFEKSIAARPDILPVRATSGIVKTMMKQGRLRDARARLVAFHKSAENATSYLNAEKEALDEAMQKRTVASSK